MSLIIGHRAYLYSMVEKALWIKLAQNDHVPRPYHGEGQGPNSTYFSLFVFQRFRFGLVWMSKSYMIVYFKYLILYLVAYLNATDCFITSLSCSFLFWSLLFHVVCEDILFHEGAIILADIDTYKFRVNVKAIKCYHNEYYELDVCYLSHRHMGWIYLLERWNIGKQL